MKKLVTTLCIIHQHPRILLGMKKRGFGAGRWNGFGGKIKTGESIEDATKREMQEESGVEIENLDKVGIMEFEFKGNPEIIEVHVFKSENFEWFISRGKASFLFHKLIVDTFGEHSFFQIFIRKFDRLGIACLGSFFRIFQHFS